MDISTFLTAIGTGATSVGTILVNTFTAITPLFWNAGSGSGTGSLTLLSILALSGVCLTIGFWAVDKVLGLAKMGLSGISKARVKKSKKA